MRIDSITKGRLSLKIASLISFSEPIETQGFDGGGTYLSGSKASGDNINGGLRFRCCKKNKYNFNQQKREKIKSHF